MNFLDILFIMLLIGVFGAVFFAGLFRALALLLTLWISLVSADVFGRLFSSFLYTYVPSIERWTSEILGFLIALILSCVLVMYLVLRSFRTIRSRSGYRVNDRGGPWKIFGTIVASAVVALVVLTVVAQIVGYALGETPPGEAPTLVVQQYRDGLIRPATNEIAEYIYNATSAWVPGGSPSILDPRS